MDGASDENGPGVNNKSSSEMDIIVLNKETRLTNNWSDSNSKGEHEEKSK